MSNVGRHHSIDVYRELSFPFNGFYCYVLFFVDSETRLPFEWDSGDIYQWPPLSFYSSSVSVIGLLLKRQYSGQVNTLDKSSSNYGSSGTSVF